MKTLFKTSLACGLLAAGFFVSGNVLAECTCKAGGTCACGATCACTAKAFVGRWALSDGVMGWLGVEQKQCGALSSSILWGGGSVVPTDGTKMDGDKLIVTRKHGAKRDGKDVTNIETITFTAAGGKLAAESVTVDDQGKQIGKMTFKGNKIPDVPAAPDLSKVKFGAPIPLLNGKDMTGWIVMDAKGFNGWNVKDGVLMNRVAAFKKHGTNLKTAQTFEDFNLKTDVNMSKGGNSGIYLRGIYEIQMADTYGQPRDPHHMGALYSRITPSVAAEKPAGEWQTIDITLVQRHLTVVLNGQKIIDNQPVLGCTGGALTSNEFIPGPIYLQGDHSDVSYRNMVIRPVVE